MKLNILLEELIEKTVDKTTKSITKEFYIKNDKGAKSDIFTYVDDIGSRTIDKVKYDKVLEVSFGTKDGGLLIKDRSENPINITVFSGVAELTKKRMIETGADYVFFEAAMDEGYDFQRRLSVYNAIIKRLGLTRISTKNPEYYLLKK